MARLFETSIAGRKRETTGCQLKELVRSNFAKRACFMQLSVSQPGDIEEKL
jgi:hypothetical protein